MDREDDLRVLEGTASVGTPSEPSMLLGKLAELREPGDQRILGHLSPGKAGAPVTVRLADDREAKPRLAAITEPLDWYTSASPWGGPVVNPGLLVRMMVEVQRRIALPADDARRPERRGLDADDAPLHEGVVTALGGVTSPDLRISEPKAHSVTKED